MYNRYIPQPDGTYRRNTVRDPVPPVSPPVSHPEPCPPDPCPPETEVSSKPHRPEPKRISQDSGNVGSFLRQLLPKNFDTSDLIIVLLLLLMAGDCPEDQNTALLTLAIYLFL